MQARLPNVCLGQGTVIVMAWRQGALRGSSLVLEAVEWRWVTCYFCASLPSKHTAQTLFPSSPITPPPLRAAGLKGAGEVRMDFKMELDRFMDADLQHQALCVTAIGLS